MVYMGGYLEKKDFGNGVCLIELEAYNRRTSCIYSFEVKPPG